MNALTAADQANSARSSLVAFRRRGNHARGTLIRRRSASETVSSSSDVSASIASGTTSTSEILIPSLGELLPMCSDHSRELAELVRRKSARFCQGRPGKPKLREHFFTFDMNVRRLATVAGVENEPLRTESSDRWHVAGEYTPPHALRWSCRRQCLSTLHGCTTCWSRTWSGWWSATFAAGARSRTRAIGLMPSKCPSCCASARAQLQQPGRGHDPGHAVHQGALPCTGHSDAGALHLRRCLPQGVAVPAHHARRTSARCVVARPARHAPRATPEGQGGHDRRSSEAAGLEAAPVDSVPWGSFASRSSWRSWLRRTGSAPKRNPWPYAGLAARRVVSSLPA